MSVYPDDGIPRTSKISPWAKPDPITGGCRFPPWGNQERPTHEYCGAKRVGPGEPYCHEHRALCWKGRPVPAPKQHGTAILDRGLAKVFG